MSTDPHAQRDPADLARALRRLQPAPTSILTPEPDYPLDAFPPVVATWLHAVARCAQVPCALVAAPFLAGAGAVIGRQLRLEVGPGWHERPALWVALVTLTGIGKTPALTAARAPFDQLHHEAWLAWRRAGAAHNRPGANGPRPAFNRLLASSASIPGLTTALEHATGLLLIRDELYGLIRAIDRRGGEDRHAYLSLWSSHPLLTATSAATDSIPNPVVSLVGGIQPRLIHRVRGRDHDGFLERFLLVFTSGVHLDWQHESPHAWPAVEPVVDLLRPLRAIAPDDPLGHTVTLTPAAAAAWREWNAENTDRERSGSLTLGGFYRKMPSHLARLTLILHALWQPQNPAAPVQEATIRHAINLATFHRAHIHRSITLIGERDRLHTHETAIALRIFDTLRRHGDPGGWLDRTRLCIALGRPEAGLVGAILDTLVNRGILETRTRRGPGRPATQYRITP